MADGDPAAEKDMWNELNIDYEKAYQNNPLKIGCVKQAISLLEPGSRVLDIGCGTGVPVSQMLADAGMNVTGTDIAPNMVELATTRIQGTFTAADMCDYDPPGNFAGIFIIYSHLGLSYADFHSAAFRFAKALQPGGILVIGASPTENHKVPEDDPTWDDTKSLVDGFNLPFWGKPFFTLMFTRKGQLAFLRSMGLEVVYDEADWFKPDNLACHPEFQQYVIARRNGDQTISEPKPLPSKRK